MVRNGSVYIIDDHTGRVSPDKRYSDGLHQALEAKERLRIRGENITLTAVRTWLSIQGVDQLTPAGEVKTRNGNRHAKVEKKRTAARKKKRKRHGRRIGSRPSPAPV